MVVLLNVLQLPSYRFSAVPKILRAEILRGKARITNRTTIMDKDMLDKIIMSLGIKIRHAKIGKDFARRKKFYLGAPILLEDKFYFHL